MPLGSCTWCRRWRLVQLEAWRSPRTGQTLSGEVCGHCFYGGEADNCRTCKARAARLAAAGPQDSVRPLTRADALEILLRQAKPRGARGA